MMKPIIAALLAATAAAAAATAPGAPGAEKLFGNWAVACDNVKRCEATALMPESWGGDEAPGLYVTREAGPAGAVTIAISPVAETPGLIDILIDRRLMGSGVMRDGSVHLTGATAEGMARAMANGRVLTLRSHRKIIATLSLSGASAALRYFDAEQGRAGGLTALVAKGPKSAAAVPGAMAVPKVPAIRPGKGKAASFTAAELDSLRTQSGCDTYFVSDWMEPQFHRLDGHTTLLLIPCVAGAYQASYAAYVATGGKIAPAPFDFPPGGGLTEKAPTLTEPEWDAEKGVLDAHAKGRGLGDCGVSQSWVWDGKRFRMTDFTALNPCRLSGSWLTRYRAEAVYK